jgi:hypothetical protein
MSFYYFKLTLKHDKYIFFMQKLRKENAANSNLVDAYL